MTKEQAEKLYQLSENGYYPMYTASPYVASVESGIIEKDGDAYTYRDSAIVDVDVLAADVEDFEVYERHDHWQDVKFPYID